MVVNKYHAIYCLNLQFFKIILIICQCYCYIFEQLILQCAIFIYHEINFDVFIIRNINIFFRYKSKYHNKMPKLMLVDGTRQNSASNSHNHQHLPIFRNKSSILNIFSNVGVLTFFVVFSIGCLSFSNAQPYKTNVNDINWARYVAPSPVEMGQDSYIEYGDDDNSVEDGIIEEEPEQETKKVSISDFCIYSRLHCKK